jgi:hypothetical protein
MHNFWYKWKIKKISKTKSVQTNLNFYLTKYIAGEA